jgi:hypothetical protein
MANTTGRKFGGRKKGTPNKVTSKIKDAVMKAFEEVGGDKYLTTIAREDPKTFCTLLCKVLPTELAGQVELIGMTHEEWLDSLDDDPLWNDDYDE